MALQQRTDKGRSGFLFFKKLSIQQRLPLLICLLLLFIVVIFGVTAYIGIKNSAVKEGSERLKNLTLRLSSMFEQSAENIIVKSSKTLDKRVLTFLDQPDEISRKDAQAYLGQTGKDSLLLNVEIRDAQGKKLLQSGQAGFDITAPIDSVLTIASGASLGGSIGKIYPIRDSMYFPIVTAVKKEEKNLGYLIKWHKVYATPQAIKQFSALIGTGSAMYIGNADKSFWTDMMKPINAPSIPDSYIMGNVIRYTKDNNESVIADLMPVKNTQWVILIEFDRSTILAPARKFLIWLLATGGILILLGMFFSWLLSRNITQPLHDLSQAASSIANGRYNYHPGIERHDELGKLARAIKAMGGQVQTAKADLENKVQDRTARLEAVNKELEAFSYSVSHDLRAPLRAINGYSMMLKEDYSATLDDEGKRILGAIMNNAKQMGALIDDLISFAGMSRKEVEHCAVDMKVLVEKSLAELAEQEKKSSVIADIRPLPECFGDQSMLKQVWLNLLGNAIKYSSRNEMPRIEIGATANGEKNIYYVKDNGVGFDMKYAHKLFGVFQRLHSASEFQGTGIGLALAQRIISKHNGEIWAESEQNKGATFFFSLPKANQV